MHSQMNLLERTCAALLACGLLLVCGCSRHVEVWVVEIRDSAGNSAGSLALRLSGKAAPDHRGKRAKITDVHGLSGFPIGAEAAVTISPTEFNADLNLGVFDHNTYLSGTRSGSTASGTVTAAPGPMGLDAGTFAATRLDH